MSIEVAADWLSYPNSDWLRYLNLVPLATPPVVFFAVFVRMLLGRPATPRPAPPCAELGAEPPAVVALLTNRWRVDERAVVATLLDLAARRRLDISEPGEVLVRLRDDDPRGLAEHERELLAHVARRTGPGRAVPLAALVPGDDRHGRAFRRRFRRAVLADAEERGLATREARETVESFFVMSALGTAANAAILMVVWFLDWRWFVVAPVVFCVVFFALAGLAMAPVLRRYWSTPQGRLTASSWLGVKAYLDGPDVFDELPPSAVTVWDRYLAYAAALGSARTAVTALAPLWSGRAVGQQPVPAGYRPMARAVLAELRSAEVVRIGEITVGEREVTTPAGVFPRATVRWHVHEDERSRMVLEPFTVALVVALMCVFPLNLVYLLFAIEREATGTVTVTGSTPTGRFTTSIAYRTGDEQSAIRRLLRHAGVRDDR